MNLLENKPNKNILYSLLLGIHLSALPTYTDMPINILLLLAVLSIWQGYIITRNNKNPKKFILLAIVSITLFITLHSYGVLFGQQAGIALVILMSILKLFEIKNIRDCHIIIFSTLFIIASNFFNSQSIWLIIYVFFIVIYLTTIQIALSDKLNTTSLKIRTNMATRYFIYAVPLMLVLFVLFPRIPGPLWGLQKDTFSSQTGMSEEMSPGSINQLISSSRIAFRVKFDDVAPEHPQRYWRGVVLSLYDGKTWRRADAPESARANITSVENDKSTFRYTITLEPTNLKWLLTLEQPINHSNKYNITREAMLTSKTTINNVINYTVTSQINAINKSMFVQEHHKNRLLPINLNPETVDFAKNLFRKSNFSTVQYINNVLKYYRTNEFFYTLNPELLGDNAMDDFLFKTRRGFCEHYASSFAYLMRAAGIPARVVIGYQGGTINPLDDYMIVRQSDAHAWNEVWINNAWIRVDPTAAVSPERVEKGVLNSGLEVNKLPLLLVTNSDVLRNAAFLYDSFQNSWNQWVINYDQKKQTDLLKALGFENATSSNLILLLIIRFSITALIVSWFLFKQYTIESDRVQLYYKIFCKKLQRFGIKRKSNEGPQDYETRVINELSLSQRSKDDVNFVFKAYRSLHYGNSLNKNLTIQFIKKVKTLKLRDASKI